jgi:HD-like signal output (HDOD) protein
MKEDNQLARKVAQLINVLPPMPDNIGRLMAADVDSSSGYKQVVDLIAGDPGLCTDLLHLAADFDHGSGKSVETIDDAARLIGVKPLVQLVGVWYANKAIREQFAGLKYIDDYFRHSRDISLSCRILAEIQNMPLHQRQMYAVAGLIHDIGRLIIMFAADKTAVRLMGTSWGEMKSVLGDEKQAWGMNHCDVGMELCKKWNFSPVLRQAVLRHHTPLVDGDLCHEAGLIFVAHFVSVSDLTGDILSTMLDEKLLASLNLDLENIADAQLTYQSRSPARLQKFRAF